MEEETESEALPILIKKKDSSDSEDDKKKKKKKQKKEGGQQEDEENDAVVSVAGPSGYGDKDKKENKPKGDRPVARDLYAEGVQAQPRDQDPGNMSSGTGGERSIC
ncbi:unnamed protein product [Boreogadus saida]